MSSLSNAELRAEEAQSLDAFSRINLTGIRDGISTFLQDFGRHGFFAEYTRHDISHINRLLSYIDWIIPQETWNVMTPADWLMLVLSIYFHDAGLVVTIGEFERRNESSFAEFKVNNAENYLSQRDFGMLSDDEREKFLYQEFVRQHHAARVRSWIGGSIDPRFGSATEQQIAITSILAALDPSVRRDLGVLCESHHLDDLYDVVKYNPRRAYGSTPKEVANLQYAAIILRTADLLHITKDRTPSISYLLNAPRNFVSDEEWAKQMQVVSVQPAPFRDGAGVVVAGAQPNTIQVSATFDEPRGYFALTRYLLWAESQIQLSKGWAETTNEREKLPYLFPWEAVNTSQVEALNFEKKEFAFDLDKPKILNLLTGHTLYNNPDVVLRELIQNSLDATRLQKTLTGESGAITVHLDSSSRILTIDDDGTGMTQSDIESHFLNIGSSRYQDPAFRRQNPQFASISRFGIGILTMFMISDEIEVFTKSQSASEARVISIRSLHGKYLIRTVAPSDPGLPQHLREHGTRIQIKIREDSALPEVHRVTKQWILFPGCSLRVSTDEGDPEVVGFNSPKEALEYELREAGLSLHTGEVPPTETCYRVVEVRLDSLDIAYVVQWSTYYRTWEFGSVGVFPQFRQGHHLSLNVAVCVQGVRVETVSPGYSALGLAALANAKGLFAPTTDVARTSIAQDSKYEEMLRHIYESYALHIDTEISRMISSGLPISYAASEGRYLVSPLFGILPVKSPRVAAIFNETMRNIRWITLDSGDKRNLSSIDELDGDAGFSTVEGQAYKSADEFLKKIPSPISLARLVKVTESKLPIPEGQLLTGYSDSFRIRDLLFEKYEVDEIKIHWSPLQAILHWRKKTKDEIWASVYPEGLTARDRVAQIMQSGRVANVTLHYRLLVFQKSGRLKVEGVNGELGLQTYGLLYIFSGNKTHEVLSTSFEAFYKKEISAEAYALVVTAVNHLISRDGPKEPHRRLKLLEQLVNQVNQHTVEKVSAPLSLTDLFADTADYSLIDLTLGERSDWINKNSGVFD